MKNKLFYILVSLLMGFSFVGNVFAADLKFEVKATPSTSTVVKGKEVSITLNLKSDSAIDMCQFKVESDSTLEYVSMSVANGWKLDEGTISNFSLENDINDTEPLTNGENILVVKYKVNDSGKVTVKTVECASVTDASNASSGTHADVVVDITAQDTSVDTTLSALEVTGGTLLTPITTTTENNQYIIKLDSSTFGLKPTASNADYQDDIVVKDSSGNVISDLSKITFKNDGGQPLMKMTITVNDKTTYNLLINYTQTDLDNSLKSVTINGKELELTAGKLEYEYKVAKDVSSLDVAAVLSDSTNFKFGADSNAPGNFTIKDAVDVIIVVEPVSSSQGASIATYTIRITKEGSSSSSADEDDDDDDKTGSSGGTTGGGGGSTGGDVSSNPQTGDVSMFIMAFILIASLAGSIVLYQKNLESYK